MKTTWCFQTINQTRKECATDGNNSEIVFFYTMSLNFSNLADLESNAVLISPLRIPNDDCTTKCCDWMELFSFPCTCSCYDNGISSNLNFSLSLH